MNPTDLGEALSNSLSLSSILILTALGLAITFGVMRVINMAHGEMMMLGAYTAYVVTDSHYLNLSFSAPPEEGGRMEAAIGRILDSIQAP